jgi:glutamate-1-semialdehyde 2,1-aminomutase
MPTTVSAATEGANHELVIRAREITSEEMVVYAERTAASQRATARAKRSLPLGVPSSFQAYDPHPVVAAEAHGTHVVDVDGNDYVDFNMGFGALFIGHGHPTLVEALDRQIRRGTLFVTPCEANSEVAELLAARFGLPQWRFTNSGTEATMDAIRVARAVSGRDVIVKVEGGYHGHHDEVMISMKPPLDKAGPAANPTPVASTKGISAAVFSDTLVIPYNDPDALNRALAQHKVAAFIVEPAMENIGICLPDDGYLKRVREICDRYGTLLIFDEVKTGITAGWGGATTHYGVQPDLIALAKSIGGGLPLGAFGGRAEHMALISTFDVLHLGTYNGNPLVMAAALATLRDICTPDAHARTIALNRNYLDRCDAVIANHDLPAHTVQLGAKGCVTWSTSRVRDYRDYKATDFDLAFAQWIFGINRGILLPPGLDEQWLVSTQHTSAEIDHGVSVFEQFADALRR